MRIILCLHVGAYSERVSGRGFYTGQWGRDQSNTVYREGEVWWVSVQRERVFFGNISDSIGIACTLSIGDYDHGYSMMAWLWLGVGKEYGI